MNSGIFNSLQARNCTNRPNARLGTARNGVLRTQRKESAGRFQRIKYLESSRSGRKK